MQNHSSTPYPINLAYKAHTGKNKNRLIFFAIMLFAVMPFISPAQPLITPDWVRQYNVSDSLRSAGFAIDLDGCIFIAAVTQNTNTGEGEITTLKYSADGVLLWAASFPNPGASLDNTRPKIKIAGSCGVVVGFNYFSSAGVTDYDIYTVKYDSTGAQQWVAAYNGTDNGADNFTGIAIDNSGNIYISGISFTNASGNDLLVVKYDSSGAQQWAALYNGSGNGDDGATAITADNSGNVYATGFVHNSSGYIDFITVKYDSDGNQLWASAFNGTDNLNDFALAITTDNSGNVIVTGSTETNADGFDLVTVKYNSSGVQQWVNYFTYNLGKEEIPVAILTDNSDNIFVTANSVLSSNANVGSDPQITFADTIILIKYTPSGIEEWAIAEYQKPSQNPDIIILSTNSTVTGLDLDAAGNPYIAGYQFEQTYDVQQQQVSFGFRFILAKYDPQGTAQWKTGYTSFDGGNSHVGICFGLGVSSEDTVYLTGGSVSNNIFAITTVKFTPCLISADAGQDVTINQGESAQIGSSPEPNITYSWNPTDGLDDPNISSPNASPFQTTEYTVTASRGQGCHTQDAVNITVIPTPPQPNDSAAWVRFYNGPDSLTDGALAISANGYIYVAGASEDSDPSFDPVLIKYDSDGNQLWVAVYDNSVGDGFVYDLAVNAQDEAYVAGFVKDTNSARLFTVLKYNSAGTLQWTGPAPGTGGEARGVLVGSDGSVYAVGFVEDQNFLRDAVIAKYSSSGQLLWSDTYDNAGGDEIGERIAIDSSGNIYIAGTGYPADFSTPSLFTIKYSSSGARLWTQTYTADITKRGVLADFLSDIIQLSFSPDNSVVVASSQLAVTGYTDFFLLKYDADGNLLWNTSYGESNSVHETITSLVINGENQIITTGLTEEDNSNSDILTAMFSPEGSLLWASVFNGADNQTDESADISLDPDGNIYVGGLSVSNAGSADFITVKYDPLGQFQWQKRYNAPNNDFDFGVALKATANDEVYIAGLGTGTAGSFDFVTIKYGHPCNLTADAGPDKTIFAGQSVQIGSTPITGNSYSWFPTDDLSDSTIANPVASPFDSTIFTLIVTDNTGCVATDEVAVNVIKVSMDAEFINTTTAPDSITNIPESIFYDNYGNIYTEEDIKVMANSHGGPHCTAGIFQLDFIDGFMGGGNPQMVNVFCQVFTDISELITNSQCDGSDPVVNISIGTGNIPPMTPNGGPLAGARLFFKPCPGNINGIIDGEVWKAINSGVNEHPDVYDASIEINFDLSPLLINSATSNPDPVNGQPASWNFNMNANPGTTEFDAYSVILHEVIHTLGFGTLIGNTGQAIGAPNGAVNHYARYDRYLKHNPSATQFINWNGCYSATFAAQTAHITSGCHVRFLGPNAALQPIFAPNTYAPGSSLSHFFTSCNKTPIPFVMEPAAIPGNTRRVPTPQEVRVLCDLGYQTTGSFGDGTLPFHTANTGTALPSCGEIVAGVGDGLPDACNTQTIMLESCGNLTSIDILANDINASTFECALISSASGGASATFNTSGAILNITPTAPGVIGLTYIPVGPSPNFQRGSAVCIQIFISPCDGQCAEDVSCNQICNHDLSNIPTDGSNIANNVSCWMRSHGSPQVYQSTTPPPPNDGFILTFAHSRGNGIPKGEGVLTWVDVCPDKNYIFSYFRKKVSVETPVAVYNNYQTLHNIHAYLLQPGNTPGIPTVSGSGTDFVIPPVPASNFLLLHEQDVISNEWEQVIFCFSTQGFTDSYQWLWLYPAQPQNVFGTLLLIDDVELTEDNFTAGEDKTINCGEQINIGENICTPHNVTYQWTVVNGDVNSIDAGATTLQCTVSPNVTTVYRLTRTFPVNPANVVLPASQGCTLVTDDITVTVLPSADVQVAISAAENDVTCGISTYSAIPANFTTYSWSVSANGTITTGQGTSQITVDWGMSSAGGTVSVTVTDATTGCPGANAITVFPACMGPAGTSVNVCDITASDFITIYNNNLALYPSSQNTGKDLYINKKFIVDVNFNFYNGTQIKFSPNAYIDMPASNTAALTELILRGCTLSAGCNEMWDGIFVRESKNKIQIANDYNLIRDAETAVVSIDGGQLLITGTTTILNKFLDNYKDIVVMPYTGSLTASIRGNLFATSTGLITPRQGQRTHIGIDISGIKNTAGITIGDVGASLLNTFDNMDIGIKTDNSITTVINNEFKNITQPSPCIFPVPKPGQTSPPCPVFAAILGVGNNTYSDNKLTVGGSNNSFKNTIVNCTNGIITEGNIYLVAKYNQFTNIVHSHFLITGVAIKVVNNLASEVTLTDNKFNKFENGVYLLECSNMLVDILSNKFNFAVASDEGGTAIQLRNATFKNQSSTTISQNNIQRVVNGILLTKWPTTIDGPNITSNNILLKQSSGVKKGIIIESTDALVDKNTIYVTGAAPTTANQYTGIRVVTSPMAVISNNVITRMGTGILFFGNSDPLTVGCNIMNFNFRGISLETATIGSQGSANAPNDNQWQNEGDKRIFSNLLGVAPNWYWRNNNTNKFNPTINSTSLSFISFSQTCTPSVCPYLCTVGSLSGGSKPFKLAALVQQQKQFPVFQSENEFLEKEFVFRELKRDNSLMQTGNGTDAVLQNFHDNMQQTNLGKIEEIKIHIENKEFADATAKNNTLVSANLIEHNYKTVHEVYLESWAQKRFNLDENEQNILRPIAEQNPVEGGRAVFTARVMLDTLIDDQMAGSSARLANTENAEPFIEVLSISENSFITNLYPNPNDGNMQLDYEFNNAENAKLLIYDMTGRQLYAYNLSAEENSLRVNESGLTSGIYFYEIKIRDEIIIKNKLLIIK